MRLLSLCFVACLAACPAPSSPDANDPDAGPHDAGAQDAGAQDAGAQDAGAQDAGAQDAAFPDANERDGGVFDAHTLPDPDGGHGPSCTGMGCLRSAVLIGDYEQAALEPLLEPGVSIDNGYSIWVIEYGTRNEEAFATSTATVAVPYPLLPPAGGYHVVANAHGTVGAADACALSGTVYGSGLAGLFGARGTVSVATDYLGLGTPGPHPYLGKAAAGASVLDSLRAATYLAQLEGVPVSLRYAVVGLSQGGHATLAAAAMHNAYAPELDIRAFGAAGPASVWLEQWAVGAMFAGPYLAVHAMLLHSFAVDEGHDGPPLFVPDLASSIAGYVENRCTFDFGGLVPTLDEVIADTPAGVFDPAFYAAYSSADLSGYPAIDAAFAKNRVTPFVQTAPLVIWQGDSDLTVPQVYTDEMVQDLVDGGVDVDYRIVPGADHLDVAFGFVAQAQLRTDESVQWVLAQLDAP